MEIAIDPGFSVYRLVERVQQQSTLLSHRQTMSIVSYEIENATLVDGAQTRIFSSFQYMSKFLPQVARYRRLAVQAESVYVFGVVDVELPDIPNVHYVPLKPTDQLAREWFLVSLGRDYFSALATEEQSRFTDPDEQRVFKGVWTFDWAMVSILEEWLTSTVGAQSLGVGEADIDRGRQVQLMSNTLGRFMTRIGNLLTQRVSAQSVTTQQEVRQVIDTQLQPSIQREQTRQG